MKIRNFVAKYSEKFNKPVIHEDKRTYKRANRKRETKYATEEWKERQSRLSEHQDRDEGGEITEAGDCNCNEQSWQDENEE